ncbi:Verru_Chthon cassette protein A [Chthoniobacter flavus]|uniref:Verru_Chthon cassette protein A n=1 Tax=Chthoniobacter flavus TaxID=191863 RepID=UPI001404947A|nr:Verru_Chthon cassette protein A [Chthoniobacter flavus]
MKASKNLRAVALVIVLGFLTLLSVLAIAFFSSISTETRASRTFASQASTRQLAETAVNLVMSQIREATVQPGAAWASQPGMIRTFSDGGGASPKANAFFKLYSARNMVVGKTQLVTFDPESVGPSYQADPDGSRSDTPVDWDKYPAIFTDLNSPVLVNTAGTGGALSPVFPIVDPRAKESVNGIPLVEGFDFTADIDKVVAGGGSDSWRVPMPTRWIYVLRDGTLTTPDANYTPSGGGAGCSWSGAGSKALLPTKDNPIVGRIAFWADDDSSKVNVNTAGGYGKQSKTGFTDGYTLDSYAGSFWDTPRFYTNFDIGQTNPNNGALIPGVGAGGLAAAQPFQKEYQRYPGHPATTSLGAVLGNLLTSEQIYKLVPRINGGGSLGGTVRTDVATAVELQLKPERLYASLDELLFSESPVNGGQRETNDKYVGTDGAITPDILEKTKFFLTPYSRSPDLNLFGLPRVTIWPVNQSADEATGRNGFDRAIAFCSTIGAKKFIFTRSLASSGALSTTNDIQQTAYSQNVALMKYLRQLTSRPIPGFGGNFESKYGTDNRDMILGEIFDYIRIANLRDTTTGMTSYQYAKAGVVAPSRADVFGTGKKIGGFGRAATISEASLVFYCSGVEAAGAKNVDGAVIPAGVFQGEVMPADREHKITDRYVRAFLLFSTFHPMQGYAPIVSPTADAEKEVFEVTGLDRFSVNGAFIWPGGTLSNTIQSVSGSTWGGRNFGGYEGFMHTLVNHHTNYAFASTGAAKVPFNQATFGFGGGEIQLTIKFGPTQVLQNIKLNFPSASWPVPRRWYRLSQGGFVKGNQSATVNAGGRLESAQNLLDFTDPSGAALMGRIRWSLQDSNNPNVTTGIYGGDRWRQIIQPGDVIRSLVYGNHTTPVGTTTSGDMRLLALTTDVPNTEFKPHPDYFDSTYRFAQGLRASDGNTYVYNMPYWDIDAKTTAVPPEVQNRTLTETTAFGNHVNQATLRVPSSRSMELPYSQGTPTANPPNGGVNGVVRSDGRAGDFDTGLGVFPDGPYANKQDEGNVIFKYFDTAKQKWIYPIPYAGNQSYEPPGDIYFSPNRQMPSPVLFGSLLSRPTDTHPARGWETLAFCPNTVGERHPGNTVTPRDHLLLDLFTMPFVEPYLISEPLSTAGRVNLNYQIAPFPYIKRSTALRAALASLRVTAISTSLLTTYKTGANGKPLPNPGDNPRFRIDRDETLKAFDSFFSHYKTTPNEGFFKSASQICERFFYPTGPGIAPKFRAPTYEPDTIYDAPGSPSGEADIINFWRQRTLTGDNVREKPYADLYPRITTKSNTYTVHVRVQTVRQVGGPSSDFSKWREGVDEILGEYRGSETIERYIDPSDPRLLTKLSDANINAPDASLEDIYRFRVVKTKQFNP